VAVTFVYITRNETLKKFRVQYFYEDPGEGYFSCPRSGLDWNIEFQKLTLPFNLSSLYTSHDSSIKSLQCQYPFFPSLVKHSNFEHYFFRLNECPISSASTILHVKTSSSSGSSPVLFSSELLSIPYSPPIKGSYTGAEDPRSFVLNGEIYLIVFQVNPTSLHREPSIYHFKTARSITLYMASDSPLRLKKVEKNWVPILPTLTNNKSKYDVNRVHFIYSVVPLIIVDCDVIATGECVCIVCPTETTASKDVIIRARSPFHQVSSDSFIGFVSTTVHWNADFPYPAPFYRPNLARLRSSPIWHMDFISEPINVGDSTFNIEMEMAHPRRPLAKNASPWLILFTSLTRSSSGRDDEWDVMGYIDDRVSFLLHVKGLTSMIPNTSRARSLEGTLEIARYVSESLRKQLSSCERIFE
jgi:hypothetical protein